MRNIAISILLAFLIPVGKAQTLQSIQRISLPVVEVETVFHEEPTCDYVDAPAGADGRSITNATKVPGSLTITLLGDTLYDSGAYEDDEAGMTIKIRGNQSAYQAKKSFKVKLQKAADLLCRGNEGLYKDKNWVLLKEDQQCLYTYMGFAMSRLVGMPWVPEMKFVNLVFNGNYRGIYMLCESVKRNRRCRIDVAPDGYIIERDAYWWNSPVFFRSHEGRPFTFRYPDEDDVTEEQIGYIKGVVDCFETSCYRGAYPDVVDVGSFARWCLAHDVLGTMDAGGSNIFMTKYDSGDSSLLAMGPLWDFGSSYLCDTTWAVIHRQMFFAEMLQSRNKAYSREYVRLWRRLSPVLTEKTDSVFAELAHSDVGRGLAASWPLDGMRWTYKQPRSLKECISSDRAWFHRRKAWMDQAVATIDTADVVTGMRLAPWRPEDDGKAYDLGGRKASPSTKGVVIRKGKKILRK